MAIPDHIASRIQEKKKDYTRYSFTRVESNALKTFFDLAQEFENIEDVCEVAVAIPKLFFDLEARLYLIDPKGDGPGLVSGTNVAADARGAPPGPGIRAADTPYCTNQSMVLTIRGNEQLVEQLPFKPADNVIGLLEVWPCKAVDGHQELFFQKYANRIGFSVHMRFLLQKNIEHVRFIKSLVADIEHNVIVPNMVYRLFLRRLRGKILKNRQIETELKHLVSAMEPSLADALDPHVEELVEVNRGLMEEFRNIERHYQSTSLFLETLLRRSHFDEGRLTLRTKPCNLKKAVIEPQLERFARRFAESGVAVKDAFGGESNDETISVVDVGLMAQVYSNFFSNALKYAEEVLTEDGKTTKYVAYGRQWLKDHFGPGQNAVKYYVFTTGAHIPEEERKNIFEEGFRGVRATKRPGSGHGLAFVKNAIEIHGGTAGYEPAPLGNIFYFILPQ